MPQEFFSNRSKTAARSVFLSVWGSSRWMSRRRRWLYLLSVVLLVAPIGALYGYLTVEGESPSPFSEWVLAVMIAAFVGLVLHEWTLGMELLEKRDYEADIRIARETQRNLLPRRLPCGERIRVAGHYEPAREVGGDYYDVILLAGGGVALVIADVSGKGPPAAILMASVRARIRSLLRAGPKLAVVFEEIHAALLEETGPTRFVTLFCGIVDPSASSIRYVNAGHEPPILVDREGNIRLLERGGPPVGLLAEAAYAEHAERLDVGDRLLLYTDGVVDAGAERDRFLEMKRIEALVVEGRFDSPEGLIDRILRDVRALTPADGPPDDITILAAAIDPPFRE